jgi:hypothetical protein
MQLLTHEIIAFYFWILNLHYINLRGLPGISCVMIIAVFFLILAFSRNDVHVSYDRCLTSRFYHQESAYLCVTLQIRRFDWYWNEG